ncbi:hypothetical protein NitaMp128 (mitochondrion) [Nicotiana tabacum]|uniref:ATP synthase YMF19-like N-terminal domain-containing protein n=1 Tax=Nicotiana tabacum TaxID=4097 RepID=Q5M9U8_TOBAC|nr:hypothetical protein NitaMp032 [Nicotiana tabacum]YP_173465.1 hypothetical protein NitaMp128 [Nicotiana tabacum]BAD83442.1 hypothetical protein [Nicotiana tabacum]BAD83530.1 hypothetical protein [Nicotiana tabacum]
MPQLDKFTYFTQFFWSCLFLILIRFYLPLDLEVKLFCYYITKPKLQRALSILKYFICLYCLLTLGYRIYANLFNAVLLHSIFGILPSELELLSHYLNQPDKDPEWVEFVRERLQTQGLSPREYEIMVRDFLNTELCFATREQISSLYQLLFYGREDPQFFIDPQDLDSILRVHLEPLEFNHPALCQVLESLCVEKHDSPFYQDVKMAQAHHFRGFINLKHQAKLEMQHRLELGEVWKSLERRNAFLSQENASLREKLLILDREAP